MTTFWTSPYQNVIGQRVDNSVRKAEFLGYQNVLLFPHCFQKPYSSEYIKVGKRVNSLPNDKFLDWSKLKELADDKTK